MIESLVAIKDQVDVLCLQEVFVESGRKFLIDKLKYYWPYYVGKANKDEYIVEDSGLMVFSKYPIISHIFYPYEPNIGVDKLSNKGFLLIKININDSDIRIINTHMQSDEGTTPGKNIKQQDIRRSQLLQISEVKSDIVVGDLNIDHKTLEYKTISQILKKRDSYLSGQEGIDRKKTYLDGQILDYIYVKSKIKVVDYMVLSNEKNKLIPSDHYAVFAEIRI